MWLYPWYNGFMRVNDDDRELSGLADPIIKLMPNRDRCRSGSFCFPTHPPYFLLYHSDEESVSISVVF